MKRPALSFRFNEDFIELLKAVSEKLSISQTDVIKLAVREYALKNEVKIPDKRSSGEKE